MMRKHLSLLLLLLLCLMGCEVRPVEVTPDKPDAKPANLYGLNDLAATVPDGQARLVLAAMCDGAATAIANDGTDGDPVLVDTKSIEVMFLKAANYRYDGKTYSTDAFRDRLAGVLDSNLQTSQEGKELTPDLKDKSIEIFQAAAWALRNG